MVSQAVEETAFNDRSGQAKTTPVAIKSNPAILHLLRSCESSQGHVLEEKRIQRVLEAAAHLAIPDPCEMLRPILSNCGNNMSLGLHALGLPPVWKGVQGAVDYIRVLDADEKDRSLDPIARRIAQVLLYFNYEELCKWEEFGGPSKSKLNATRVLDRILDEYSDDPRISKPRQARRNKISGYHMRRGKWWWRLAATLGVGILLVGDSSLTSIMCVSRLGHYMTQMTQMSRYNKSFTNDEIDVLAAFVINTRPGTTRFFRALEPFVKSLMFGLVTDDLHQAISNNKLRLDLKHAHDEDEVAVAYQRIGSPWPITDARSYANDEMTRFLASVPAT